MGGRNNRERRRAAFVALALAEQSPTAAMKAAPFNKAVLNDTVYFPVLRDYAKPSMVENAHTVSFISYYSTYVGSTPSRA